MSKEVADGEEQSREQRAESRGQWYTVSTQLLRRRSVSDTEEKKKKKKEFLP